MDEAGVLRGEISSIELRPALHEPAALHDVVVAIDLARTDFAFVDVGDSLDAVLKALDANYRDELPVLENGHFVGVVRIQDVIGRYRREVAQREVPDRGAW